VTLTGVDVTDPLPGMSDITGGDTTLDPDEMTTFTATYVVTQADVDAGQIDNTATADVSLGDTLTYSFDVTNTGNVTLTGVDVTDPLPGMSDITGGDTTLDPDETTTFTATYVVTQADVDAGQIDNTATAVGTPPIGPDVTDMDSEMVSIAQMPVIQLEKYLSDNADEDVSGTVSLGDTLTYSFKVTNADNVTLTDVDVTDPLPGLSDITGGATTLASGEMTIFTATYVVTQADVDAGVIENTATAVGTPPSGPDVTDMDDETVPIPQNPGIDVDKSLQSNADEDGSGTVSLGDTLTFAYDVTNTGNVTLDPVDVTDPLPGLSAITCPETDLAPGESMTCTATYVVTQDDVDAGQIVNTGTATGTPPEGEDVTDEDTNTVPIPQNPDIDLDKFLSANADEDGSGTVTVGDTLTYSFDVTNIGNVTLTAVDVTDPLPGMSDITGGDPVLSPGEMTTFSATYVVTQADEDVGAILNEATAVGTDPDGQVVSDTDDEVVPVAIIEPPEPSPPLLVLGADKADGSQPYVQVIDGLTGEVTAKFLAYESWYEGGVRVATGDLTGDGVQEIVTAPGRSHEPEVRVFTQTGIELNQFRFLAYAASFDGGVQVDVGDVDGDGKNDIVTAPTAGPSVIKVFRNEFNAMLPSEDPICDTPYREFLAFDPAFDGGAVVKAADMGTFLNGVVVDPAIVVGNGAGMRSTVHVFDASSVTPDIVRTFLPFDDEFRGGVSIALDRITADLIPDLVVGAGNGGDSAVEVWDGRLATRLTALNAYSGPSRHAPVRVATLDVDADGIADRVITAQGTDGKTRLIKSFNPLTGALVDAILEDDPDFLGQYFVDTIDSEFDEVDSVL